ncbi:winged helix-turn-helix domain-containing protein [Trabulsiella odontotermitis]|uniref:winged helix-turn-helix domain-containing protein n=1 Tax=Trabulsiella odontotermitis TaxID=379893 RepID=UPI00092D15E8|nr:winged helix-turn-helix domain-containing protein [Trabulsiella odontotermitis]
MKKGFLINNIIEFWPEDNRLSSRYDSRNNFSLTTPASRCFYLLLKNSPGVVSPKMFFQYVWDNEGKHVPMNALYQNISLIRKGIKSITGSDDAMINTITRSGFQIRTGTIINEIMAQEQDNNTISSCANNARSNHGVVKKSSCYISLWKKWTHMNSLSISFLCISWGILILLWQNTKNPQENFIDFFNNYKLVGKYNGCHIMLNTDYVTWQEGMKKIDSNLNCKVYPWVYLTVYKYVPTRNIIGCNKSFTAKGNVTCISLFVRR